MEIEDWIGIMDELEDWIGIMDGLEDWTPVLILPDIIDWSRMH